MKDSPRILLARLSAIGDVIHTMPIACALKDHFAESRLTWVIGRQAAGLLRGHEAVDEVIALDRGWLKSPRAVWRLRSRLRAGHFGLAIDAQGLTKSAVIPWLAGCPRRIGLGNPWGREFSRWLNNELVDTADEHAVLRGLRLLRPLGIDEPTVRFGMVEMPGDRAAVDQTIRSVGMEAGRFVMLHVGAGWPSKCWPADRFAAVAAHLGMHRNMPTLVTAGNEAEREVGEQIIAAAGGHARLAPPVTLAQLAAVARSACLCLGSDTGPLHLAAAVGTPCVGLYGPWPAEQHGPFGPQHVVVQKRVCPGSTRQRRKASTEYMEAIDVPSVCDACEKILDRDGRQAA